MTTAVSLEHRRVTWVSVAVVALRTFQECVRAPVKLLEQYVPTSADFSLRFVTVVGMGWP